MTTTLNFANKEMRELSARYDALKIEYEELNERYNNCANANFEQNKLLLRYKEVKNSKNILIEKYKVYLNDIHPHIQASLSFIGLTYFVYILAGILRLYLQ